MTDQPDPRDTDGNLQKGVKQNNRSYGQSQYNGPGQQANTPWDTKHEGTSSPAHSNDTRGAQNRLPHTTGSKIPPYHGRKERPQPDNEYLKTADTGKYDDTL